MAASLLVQLLSSAACAASGDVQALERQVDTLSERVRALEARVKYLERNSPQASGSPSGLPGRTTPKEAWRGIKNGWTQGEVLKVLGKPEREFTLEGRRVWYYYYPGTGAGSVVFDADERVMGNQPPPFSPWGY
jgi:hypothetical protein